MSLSQGRIASLGHSEITELSFLDQFLERSGRFLNRNLGVDSSALEQIQFLGSPEMLVDVVDTVPQTLLTAKILSYNSEGTKG